jgi:carbonic anhydrase
MPHTKSAPLAKLFAQNQEWAKSVTESDPDYFKRLANQQNPDYLWIGCSDSRVPANQIVGLAPGEVFVHRNIANLVVHTDFNVLSVLQFAIDQLRIKHIMVVGHYGCSGVNAAMQNLRVGLADNWIRHIKDVHEKHTAALECLETQQEKFDRLCELNVMEQVFNVCQTTSVQDAWARGQALTVHGCVYGLKDGLLNDLEMNISNPDEMRECQNILSESSGQARTV